MTTGRPSSCPLCDEPGGALLWLGPEFRVIAVDEPHYPGFCRVVWNDHVREMSDLDAAARERLMRAVFAVEDVVRRLYAPDKINLASFGNVVPHLHWHIIPRWRDDRHFPEPVWGKVQREDDLPRPAVGRDRLAGAIAQALAE